MKYEVGSMKCEIVETQSSRSTLRRTVSPPCHAWCYELLYYTEIICDE